MMKFIVATFTMAILLSTNASAQPDLLADVKQTLRANYDDVVHTTIDEYLESSYEVVLIDVRETKEFEVSHIPNALHAPNEQSLIDLAEQHKGQTILLYCSVGQRSAEAARFLKTRGHGDVKNLEGSIFEWANRKLPMENEQGKTQKVHPYNFFWGWRYLTEEARSK